MLDSAASPSSRRPGTVTSLLDAVRSGSMKARDDLACVVYDELSGMARGFIRHEAPANRPDTAALVNEAYMRLVGRAIGQEKADGESCDAETEGKTDGDRRGTQLPHSESGVTERPLSERGATQRAAARDGATPSSRERSGGNDVARSGFDDRRHFFGAAARAMRRILIDAARERRALKRGGGGEEAAGREGVGQARHRRAGEDPDGLVDPDQLARVESLGVSPDELDGALDELQRMDPRGAEVVHLRFFAGLSEARVGEVLGLSERQVRRDWQHARAWLLARLQSDLHGLL